MNVKIKNTTIMKLNFNNLTRYAAAFACTAGILACTDLKELEDRVDSLESRVTALETQVPALNENLEAISQLMDGAKFITSVTAVEGSENEYIITMSDGESYTIVQGQIGNTPLIAVDEEGYWVVDYEGDGTYERIKFGGNEDGLDVSAAPEFSVSEDGYWQISIDGETFEDVLDSNGDRVYALSEGSDFFQGISYDEETGELSITLSDGQTYTFTVSSDFVCQILDREGNPLSGTVAFIAGISQEFDVRMRGVADVYIQKPDGWSATLEDTDASGSEEVMVTLTVTPPDAAAGSLSTKVSADSDSDLVLHATAAASDRAIFAKMTVAVSTVAIPEAEITAGDYTENSVSFTVTPNADVTSWKYMLLPASSDAPAEAADFDDRATTVEDNDVQTLTLSEDATGEALAAGTEYVLYVLAINSSEAGEVSAISSASATPMYDNLYTAYENNADIRIGDRVYNKAEYGEAVHITADNPSISGSYAAEGDARIYFVDPDANATYDYTGNVYDMVIIGAESGTRSKLTINQQIKLNKGGNNTYSGQFVVHNIDFDASSLANYPLVQNWAGNFEYVMFDDCRIECNVNNNRPLSYIDAQRGFADFNMIGCTYVSVSETQNYIINAGSKANGWGYGNLTFENNIFYAESGNSHALFLVFRGTKNSVESFRFNNNTIINLNTCNTGNQNGIVYANTVTDIEMTWNLIYNDQEMPNNSSLARIDSFADTPPTTASIQNNVAYTGSNTYIWRAIYGDRTMAGVNPVDIISDDPFTGGTYDPESGTFIPNSTYSSYGAQR